VQQQKEKPVLAVLMGREGLPQGLAELQRAGIPGYRFPESAARALGAMYRHRRWLERPEGRLLEAEVDAERVRGIIAAARAERRDRLSETEAMEVLSAYGIPVAPFAMARDGDEAVAAAERMGFPVVLKVIAEEVVHKSDVGGVRVGIESAEELRDALQRMRREVPERAGIEDGRITGFLVQKMVGGGRETIVGLTGDPGFGRLLMFGLGGIYVEALRDVVFRVHPVTDLDAREMVDSIRGVRLLEGIRGEPPADREAIADVIQRISQLSTDHPEIAELDINPFLAFESGGVAVDGRISLTAPGAGR
jgi:acetate---CoA ligase (ADP-forming)